MVAAINVLSMLFLLKARRPGRHRWIFNLVCVVLLSLFCFDIPLFFIICSSVQKEKTTCTKVTLQFYFKRKKKNWKIWYLSHKFVSFVKLISDLIFKFILHTYILHSRLWKVLLVCQLHKLNNNNNNNSSAYCFEIVVEFSKIGLIWLGHGQK